MKMIYKAAALALAGASALAAQAAPHISETLKLKTGWNAVYIESTPDNALCDAFFAGTPVIGAASYQSDADAATAQYDENGREIEQAPISYLQWIRDENVSTLKSIVGGSTFLLYATNATEITFQGVPAAPRMTWHKVSATETNEFLNLAGVSSASTSVSIQAYFGEGPFGSVSSKQSAIYSVSGTDVETTGPELKDASKGSFGRLATIAGGKAYAMTATSAGYWPGVIGVQGSDVSFGSSDRYASIKVKNCGTTNHVFSISMVRSASGEELPPISRRLPRSDAIAAPGWTNVEENVAWTVELDANEVAEQIFSIDRSRLVDGTEYGAILVIEDLGGSQMRVRLPVGVEAAASGDVAYPTGLWCGEVAFTKVSRIDDETPTPVTAGGALRMNVMMHVAPDGKCTLLQRVAACIDTNGTARLFKELSDVPEEIENARRFSTVLLSVDTPYVEAREGAAFGDATTFSWTIAPTARDNPFRHAWHPDHDGKKADYSDYLPAGDNFELYKNPIKPELWSISNRIDFSWHEQGNGALPVVFPYTPDETTTGVVTWEVTGLTAKGPIASVGTFSLKRVFKAKELE